jgi:hypothetical protein
MNDLIKYFYNPKNDIFGFPQIYRNIKFYPLKILDTEYLDLFYKIFQYPKNYIPEKEIIKMSYLKFLVRVIQATIDPQGEQVRERIVKFLKYITKKENIIIYFTFPDQVDISNFEELLENVLINIAIDNQVFTEQDFDVIREIILVQNGLSTEYIESYNPELEKYLEFENRQTGDITFEDEIWIFCSLLNKTIKEIESYTLYQFKKQLERLLLIHNYNLYKPLEVSGQISSKDGREIVKNFMIHFKESEGRYDSILIKQESYVEDNPSLFNSDFKLEQTNI